MKIPSTSNTKLITNYALKLFDEHYEGFMVRSVAISCSKLMYQTAPQLDLFDDAEKQIRQEKLDYLCDRIRSKYGFKSLVHASSLLDGATAISRSAKVGGH
ncbi:DNA polymerase V [Enterococcus sp. DIV2379]